MIIIIFVMSHFSLPCLFTDSSFDLGLCAVSGLSVLTQTSGHTALSDQKPLPILQTYPPCYPVNLSVIETNASEAKI